MKSSLKRHFFEKCITLINKLITILQNSQTTTFRPQPSETFIDNLILQIVRKELGDNVESTKESRV